MGSVKKIVVALMAAVVMTLGSADPAMAGNAKSTVNVGGSHCC